MRLWPVAFYDDDTDGHVSGNLRIQADAASGIEQFHGLTLLETADGGILRM
jgi:hypothetical protein